MTGKSDGMEKTNMEAVVAQREAMSGFRASQKSSQREGR